MTSINKHNCKYLVRSETSIYSVKMNFGTPQVKHGREGVCKMECWDSQKSESSTTSYRQSYALVDFDQEKSFLILRFLCLNMDKIMMQYFIDGGMFILKSNFHFFFEGVLSDFQPLQIDKGRYKVEKSPQYMTVCLPFCPKKEGA
jgi:hypothetical protein